MLQLLLVAAAVRAGVHSSSQSRPRPWRYENHHDAVAIAAPCPTSSGLVCFAPATGCCVSPYSPTNKTGCLVPAIANPTGGCKAPCHKPGSTCCTPGAPLPPSATLKNVLIFGDSVSIDYVGDVKRNLSDVALVQHAPWDTSNGGAGAPSTAEFCLTPWSVPYDRA